MWAYPCIDAGCMLDPMLSEAIRVLSVLAALGSGVVAGVFFAFSSFVLPALARLSGLRGAEAMQSINVVVLNRSFLGVFVGTAFISVTLLVATVLRGPGPHAGLRIAGAVAYLLGSFLVTLARSVPCNDLLAELDPNSPRALAGWRDYVAHWGPWNHVRTAGSILASILLTLSLSGAGE